MHCRYSRIQRYEYFIIDITVARRRFGFFENSNDHRETDIGKIH